MKANLLSDSSERYKRVFPFYHSLRSIYDIVEINKNNIIYSNIIILYYVSKRGGIITAFILFLIIGNVKLIITNQLYI